MKFHLEQTVDQDLNVTVTEGTGWLVYVTQGGSGLEVRALEAGETWREGTEELVGVYESREEANRAMDACCMG